MSIDNKQLLIKFKREFLHWLEGGAVWRGNYDHVRGWSWVRWRTDEKPNWEQSLDDTIAFVIDDEYAVYRKAEVEGKIVQFNFGNYGEFKEDFPNKWKDVDAAVGILADRAHPNNYRIEPEVATGTKAGDWIRIPTITNILGEVVSINGTTAHVRHYTDNLVCQDISIGVDKLEPWVAVKGELVIPDNLRDDYSFVVTKYIKTAGTCVPYIGKVPKGFE